MLTGSERPGLPLDIDRFPSKPVHPQVIRLYHFLPHELPRIFRRSDTGLFDCFTLLPDP